MSKLHSGRQVHGGSRFQEICTAGSIGGTTGGVAFILDVRSLRAEALASHHFLVLARFARDLIARTFFTRTAKRTKDRTSLKEAQHSNAFAALFQGYAEQAAHGKNGDINNISTSITEAFDYA